MLLFDVIVFFSNACLELSYGTSDGIERQLQPYAKCRR